MSKIQNNLANDFAIDVNESAQLNELELQLKQFLHTKRKSMNISQRELSKMSGVHQANLSKIENGIINPSIATICKIAECLGHKVELRFVPNFEEQLTSK